MESFFLFSPRLLTGEGPAKREGVGKEAEDGTAARAADQQRSGEEEQKQAAREAPLLHSAHNLRR